MIVVENNHSAFFDCDDTLVMWLWDQDMINANKDEMVWVGTDKHKTWVLPNKKHIELLKRYKAKGKIIFVWTQSGYAWGEAVVKALGLEEYVDFVLTKPEKYVDDLDANEWMEHVYLGQKNEETPHN